MFWYMTTPHAEAIMQPVTSAVNPEAWAHVYFLSARQFSVMMDVTSDTKHSTSAMMTPIQLAFLSISEESTFFCYIVIVNFVNIVNARIRQRTQLAWCTTALPSGFSCMSVTECVSSARRSSLCLAPGW